MFGGVIARRVNAVMKERIKAAQEKYDLESKRIDEETDVKVQDVYATAESSRREVQDTLVSSIIGK